MKRIALVLLVSSLVLGSCNGVNDKGSSGGDTTGRVTVSLPTSFPKIDREPAASTYYRGTLASLPTYIGTGDPFEIDLRGRDLRGLDLRKSAQELANASFDDRTSWPGADMMPAGFDWKAIMEVSKNPGLGLRRLHGEGIDGANVGIAIIDQPLIVGHREYASQIRMYEEIGIAPGTEAQMHGCAVTSIAVGKSVGVAPGADLYYISAWNVDWGLKDNEFTYNFTHYAKAVRRIIELNKELPPGRRIRVIAMQTGWNPDQKGYEDIEAAVAGARSAGIFVVSSNLFQYSAMKFHGLDRNPASDPDRPESYLPGRFYAKSFFNREAGEIGMVADFYKDRLMIPMDARTTASPTGKDDYVFYRDGGWSWVTPYIAGVYALAAQVDPGITPERFWALALKTGRTTTIAHEGKNYALGPIIDPVALIAELQKK